MSDYLMPIDLRQISTGQSEKGTARTNSSATSSADNALAENKTSESANKNTQQDSVVLSDKSQLVSTLLTEISARPQVNESRVAALKSSIASGEFSVSADKIASNILSLDDGLRKLT